jgi:stage III sporulation protein AE
MKKKAVKLILLGVCLCFCIMPYISCKSVNAAAENTEDVEKQLQDNVDEQLRDIDTTLFDKFIYSLDGDSFKIFGSSSFLDKLKSILSGDISTDYGSVFSVLAELFFSQAIRLVPLLASIAAIAILSNLLSVAKSEKSKTGETVHFVCYMAIVLIVLNMIYQIVKSLMDTLSVMSEFMGLLFPVLLTLMTASGSAVSSSVYQPAVALLCGSATAVIINIIIPLFIASMVLSVISDLTDNIKVSKFADFFKSAGNWITGIMFTVFMAFLSIQGITASTHDSVSIRAVKYALNNSIPIVGGYIKEGFDLVLGSTILIKNAVGVAGLILLFAYIITPLFNLIVFSLGLKLTAAVCQPVSDAKVPSFLHSASKNFSLLLAAFISVSFMFFITVMLLLMTSNSVLV